MKEKSIWYKNGKKMKTDKLPRGLYNAAAPDYFPVMIDENYNGFRIVYVREDAIKSCNFSLAARDAIDPMKSMADGKMYTSKSEYYKSLKASDSHIIEAGEHKSGAQDKLRGDFGCHNELRQAIQKHLH